MAVPFYAHFRSVNDSGKFKMAYVSYSLLLRLHLTWTRINQGRGTLRLSWGYLDLPYAPATVLALPCPAIILRQIDKLRKLSDRWNRKG